MKSGLIYLILNGEKKCLFNNLSIKRILKLFRNLILQVLRGESNIIIHQNFTFGQIMQKHWFKF